MSSKHTALRQSDQQVQQPFAVDHAVAAGWTVSELQHKLDSLPTIEQAKGIVMGRFHVDADAAFQVLIRWSQTNNVKVRVICEALTTAVADAQALDALVGSLQHQTYSPSTGGVEVLADGATPDRAGLGSGTPPPSRGHSS
jgi:hypothetical protein